MTYPTSAQIEAAVPAAGEPVRSLTQAVLKDMAASLPLGTTRQIARFNATSRELEAGLFTADMWSEFTGGAPTTGVWLAAYIPESPEVMGFAKAETFPSSNSVPIRTSGEGPFTAGRIKASPATDPEDCVIMAQLQAWELVPANWGPFPVADTDPLTKWVPGMVVNADSTGVQQGYFSMSEAPAQKSIAMRDGDGRMKAVAGVARDDVVTVSQLPTGGSVTPTAAPTITIGDPVDDENVQASFDALIAALKTAGVLT